ncbi:hypothetical protein K438DRAFT_1992562 [Mycena galopus ATCC 62051]|nr:hypothetical protein K438DRAFT_1992562 [Mycena galopus ATCC 62051]
MPDGEGFMTNVRLHNRRGNFAQILGGNSHGGAQLQPGALVNGIINTAIFAALIALTAFQKLVGFATGLFANWAPNFFDFYIDYLSIRFHDSQKWHKIGPQPPETAENPLFVPHPLYKIIAFFRHFPF